MARSAQTGSPDDSKTQNQLLQKMAWLPTKIASTWTIYFFIFLSVGCFFGFRWINSPIDTGPPIPRIYVKPLNKTEFPLACAPSNTTQTCSTDYPAALVAEDSLTAEACPDYFRWIHEDLRPWKTNGISREMVEAAKSLASFRLIVVDGRIYVEEYRKAFQTRDVFTVWGILQLLRLYPGKLPDLDLMFQCDDKTVIGKRAYRGRKRSAAPPLFRYCGDDSSLDIAFPDWSFWGWPETNIKPWVQLMRDLEEGNRRTKWMDRAPYAYWKGNLHMGRRALLLKCNSTKDWNALIYWQRWGLESRRGFKTSSLANQCTHRYKIYMEGKGWSVSEKYIQACDSMLLLVKARYYEFFTRSLVPMKHYWPINPNSLCRSIKFAVNWGNSNPLKAEEIGKAGSEFIKEELKMKVVYDYMFHLLSEYARLLRYKPIPPPGAAQVCSESMACAAQGLEKQWKLESLVMAPSRVGPCSLPPPYESHDLKEFIDMKENVTRQVEQWEAKEIY
ncbi:hypothetical protein Nepgr_002366 [Nepenthes gracilis]|uniref:Glycosyl transferase CAP10 domain-containing protein n=1 Tax=Nepenthes gracilis TaxID=150966 RepID=A0AAD3RWU4_NEPGR|nr:hypothetical protein Nepgr_002366 [Nepenthes gracilis]